MTAVALVLLFLNGAIISYMYVIERRSNSITQLIWPLIFLFFVIPTGFQIIFSPDTGFSPSDISYGLLYALLFTISYFAAFGVLIKSFAPSLPVSRAEANFRRSDLVFVVAAIVAIASLLISNEIGVNTALESTWRSRSDLGLVAIFIIWLLCFLAGKFCLAFESKRYIAAGSIATVFILLALLFRTRDLVGVAVISFVLYLVVIRRSRFSALLVVGTAGAIAAISLRAVRLLGSLRSGLEYDSFRYMMGRVLEDVFITGDLSVYRVYYQIVGGCGRELVCFEGTIGQQIASLTGLVDEPRLRFEYYLYAALNQAGVGGSLHPTAFGIAYGEYGLLAGCAFFAIFGTLNFMLTRLSSGMSFFIFVGFSAHYSLFFARGSIYNGLTVAFIGVFLTLVFKFFERRGQNRTRSLYA